ncbi:MAG: F0F1 ATP synthase subunit delta [Candidatus Saccharibacteria bacterium]
MAVRLSRRKIASYYAKSLIDGVDAKQLAKQLAGYLIESKRIKEQQLIISDIEYQLSLRGVVVANVTSAHELDELTKTAIEKLVRQNINADDVQLRAEIDASLLGGLRLEFAGSEIDTTIARRLTALKTNYKK